MDISVGHTPDADDAFMFYGMLSGKVTAKYFTVRHVVEDLLPSGLALQYPQSYV